FIFQAEDGIRDRNVTGVQTCALPISCYIYKAIKCCFKYTKHALLPKKRSTNSVTFRYVDNFIHTFPIDLSIINTKIFDLCTKYTHRHVDNFYLVYPTVSW